MRKVKKTHKKIKKKSEQPVTIKLPPEKFDTDYEYFLNLSHNAKVRVCISGSDPSKDLNYFKVILFKQYKSDWYSLVVFDTYHQEKVFAHGHRRIGTTDELVEIQVPYYRTLKGSLQWVVTHIHKEWRNYVRMFYREVYRELKKLRKLKRRKVI